MSPSSTSTRRTLGRDFDEVAQLTLFACGGLSLGAAEMTAVQFFKGLNQSYPLGA